MKYRSALEDPYVRNMLKRERKLEKKIFKIAEEIAKNKEEVKIKRGKL